MRYWTRERKVKNSIGFLLLPVVILLMFRWFEYMQVFQPSRSIQATGASLGIPWEDVNFAAADGARLNGWFFPASREAEHKDRVVFFAMAMPATSAIGWKVAECCRVWA